MGSGEGGPVDLGHWIEAEGRLTPDDAVGWALRLVMTLQGLHKKGLAHGAVCLEAVEATGHACSADGELVPASRMQIRPAFFSAERAAGEPPTPADDVWAIGVVLYKALTGKLPVFGPPSFAPKPLASHGCDAPDAQKVLERLFHRDRSERIATAHDLRVVLERLHPRAAELAPLDLAHDTVRASHRVRHASRPLLEAVEAESASLRPAASTPAPAGEDADDVPQRDSEAAFLGWLGDSAAGAAGAPSDAAPPDDDTPTPPKTATKDAIRAEVDDTARASADKPVGQAERRDAAPPRVEPVPTAEAKRARAEPQAPSAEPRAPSAEARTASTEASAPNEKRGDAAAASRTVVRPKPELVAAPVHAERSRRRVAPATLLLGVALAMLVIYGVLRSGGQGKDHAAAPAGSSARPTSSSAPPAPATSASAAPSSSAPGAPSDAPVDRDSCMVQLFAEGTFAGAFPSFEAVCRESQPRKGARAVKPLIVRGRRGRTLTDGMIEWSLLGWYEMAAFAVMHGRCCEAPLDVGHASFAVCGIGRALEALHTEAKSAGDLDARLEQYAAAAHCAWRSNEATLFGQTTPPTAQQAESLKKMIARARR